MNKTLRNALIRVGFILLLAFISDNAERFGLSGGSTSTQQLSQEEQQEKAEQQAAEWERVTLISE